MRRNELKRIRTQQGFLMIIAILFIVVIGTLSALVAYMFVGSSNSSNNYIQADYALYLAESGLEQAIHQLLTPNFTNRSACSGLNISNNFGAGTYTVTSTGPSSVSSPATLNGALNATATTIPVTSTSGYQSSGRIMIDRELINYGSVDATDFNGVTRGVDGSTATSHASGTSVGQYQCSLSSQGGVPSLAASTNTGFAKRSLQAGVQLQDGWTVAQQANNSFTFARWNNPTELLWNNASVSSGNKQDLLGISAVSYTDVWAVGKHQGSIYTLLHWNGNAWAEPSITGSADLNSVYCNQSNDCWAVGQNQSNYPTFLHYNGTTWALVTPTAQANSTAYGVYCNSTSDCWAVGQSLKISGTNYPLFEHYNGSNWSLVTPAAQANQTAYGVYCNSSSDCWAVGQQQSNYPLLEHYNGSSWTAYSPTTQVGGDLRGVYCNNTNDCWAVGQHLGGNIMLFLHWNGTNWSLFSPNISGNNDLHGVTCRNTNDCWAVGQNATFMHWNGSTWTQVSSPSAYPNNVIIYGISLLGSGSRPKTGWNEIFA